MNFLHLQDLYQTYIQTRVLEKEQAYLMKSLLSSN